MNEAEHTPEKMQAEASRPCTDLGNAERLADRAAGRLLWVRGIGWLTWDGSRWKQAVEGEEVREAAEMVRAINLEEAQLRREIAAEEDGARREELRKAAEAVGKWARSSEAAIRIRAALDLGRSQEVLVASADSLDADPSKLNVANGILDLETLELSPHDPAARHTRVAAAAYYPSARSDRWEAFLARVLPSEEVRSYVQRAVGSSLLGRYSEHLFIPWGSGKNGKSTFLWAVRHALGDYAMEGAPELLIEKRGARSAGDMSAAAELRGRRLVTTIETGEGKRLAETFVKQLTGERTLKAKQMRMDWFEFENQTSIWLATNHKPRVEGSDTAIWERLHLIPFGQYIPPHERDPQLTESLVADADAVLAWAVKGLRMARELGGLAPPNEVLAATEEYREEMDPLAEWLDDQCVLGDGGHAAVSAVRSSYELHCQMTGIPPLDGRRFNSALEARGLRRTTRRVGGKSTKIWDGLKLWQVEYMKGQNLPSVGEPAAQP